MDPRATFALGVGVGIVLMATLASADAPVRSGAQRVDGVVAVIGAARSGQGLGIILRSDVELVARLSLRGAGVEAAATVDVPDNVLQAAYEQLLGEMLIAREAERVQVPVPGAPAVAEELARIAADAGGEAAFSQLLADLSATPDEVEEMAARRALVAAFLQINLEGTAVATDAEVDAVYESGEHPFEEDLESVREELRAWIGRRALSRAVRRWVSVLRARNQVEALVTYSEGVSE